MKTLNTTEINTIGGGQLAGEIRYCDVEKTGDPHTVYARLSFGKNTDSKVITEIYDLIKKQLFNNSATVALSKDYVMSCYIMNQ